MEANFSLFTFNFSLYFVPLHKIFIKTIITTYEKENQV